MNKIIEGKMAVANAVEDLALMHVHAYIAVLRDDAYLTEEQILKSLAAFDESLQAPDPE